MTNTGIGKLTTVQKSNTDNIYSYVGKNLANSTMNSFGSLMQKSIKNMSDKSSTSKTIQEKMTSRRSQVEYIVRGARHTGDGKAVDESAMTGSLKALTSDVKAVVCAVLDVTDEELERLLAENGLCAADLLLQNNLADFITAAMADGDALKLLTDSEISEAFSQLGEELRALLLESAQELDMPAEELAAMLKDYGMQTEGSDMSEALQKNDGGENLTEKLAAQEMTDTKLEDKISFTSEENTEQYGMSNDGGEGLSAQFLKTLVGNVENTAVAESTFEGYSVNAEDIVRQLVDSVKVNVNSALSEMELQLQPENLGKLNLIVASKDGVITAQLTAQNEAVKNVIENQLVMLKESFEQQGLKVDAVEVTLQSHGFETGKNLEGRENNTKDDSQHRSSRRLTIEEINAIIGDEDASDEDLLAAQMLQATGGSVDYMV